MKAAGRSSLPSKILSLVLIGSLACAPLAARAQSDDEAIAEQVARAAADAAIKELGMDAGRRLVDYGFQTTPVPAGQSSVGTEALGFVRIGLSVKEFFDAKNDEGRFYATLDTAAAVLAMTVPVAGAIAAGVLMAARFIEAGLAAGHAREMLEIAKRTQEHILATVKIIRQIATADVMILAGHFGSMMDEFARLNEIQQSLAKSCGFSADTAVATLADCQMKAIQVLPLIDEVLYHADRVLQFQSPYVTLDAFLEKNGTNREKFSALTEGFRKESTENRTKLEKVFAATSTLIAKAAVAQAKATGSLTPLQDLRNTCYQGALEFNRRANLALIGSTRNVDARRGKLETLYAESVASFDRGCHELVVDADDPLLAQLTLRRQTLAAVAQNLGYDLADLSSEE